MTYLLNPEFVSQYLFLVIPFFILVVSGVMYYLRLRRNLQMELSREEERLRLRQEQLQNDLAETMKELVVMQTEIRDHHLKIDSIEKKDIK